MRSIFLAMIFALSTGCIVTHGHHHGGGRSSARASKSSRCHPSQYWDGSRCVHKGKGRGARKHDG